MMTKNIMLVKKDKVNEYKRYQKTLIIKVGAQRELNKKNRSNRN